MSFAISLLLVLYSSSISSTIQSRSLSLVAAEDEMPSDQADTAQSNIQSNASNAELKNAFQSATAIMENYPTAALAEEMEGIVHVRLAVSAKGRVEGCEVMRSSGYNILDKHACKGMRRFARFKPARDDAGRSVASYFDTTVNYELN